MQTNHHWLAIKSVLTLGVILLISSCSTTSTPNQKPPGFLDNYSILKPMPTTSDDDVQIYAYTNPDVNRNDYHAVIIDPVIIYQTATESGITESQIQQSQIKISNGVKELVKNKFALTNKPGKGVARVKIGITGAILEGDGFKPRYLIPVSGIIQLASLATGLENKTPVFVIETKTTDSQTGKLLRETVATIKGEKFRSQVHTQEEFDMVAEKWVKEAVLYSNIPNQPKK